MPQSSKQPSFTLEGPAQSLVGEESFLERNLAIESLIAREVDRAHPTGCYQSLDKVPIL
jgi:hypothetical protein